MSSINTSPTRLLDLEALESDPTPIFIVKTGDVAIEFDFLLCNEALRKLHLRETILGQNRAALLFRSWCLALGKHKPYHEFADRVWSAELSSQRSNLKVVKAERSTSTESGPAAIKMKEDVAARSIFRRSRDEITAEIERDRPVVVQEIPRENPSARWETIQTMMEMSDVGVFEYNSEGRLLHANEAWYRLSSHPRNLPEHIEFSFIDLVYPDDQALVMSMWDTLTQGHSVTFEMRWKPRPASDEDAQWVLSACVPVFDDKRELIRIAGNTIDINAQKRSQQAAQAQVEALEQARLSELKFARFAQLSPTAIYIYVPGSGMKFVNDQFFELTGHAHAPIDQFEWFDLISKEDVERFQEDWASMLEGKRSHGVQFRLKKTWINQDGICSNIWVQSSSYPELDHDGKVISIMGTLFDISQFKWAESVQRRRIEEALESKRQQENFIDMTSHELRNPLSAVVQCADSVIASLEQLLTTASGLDPMKLQAEVDTCIDSLQTIVSCSQHQKRVIDDVLTLSKLDSNLILITPTRVQPVVAVTEMLKIFDAECSQTNIEVEFRIDETFAGMEWVMLDPSRLLQVLINLFTNAIKFTKDCKTRKITVSLGGSWTQPPNGWQEFTFADDQAPNLDLVEGAQWGQGRKAYIWITVTDTGCGMTENEQKRLFSRFSQATPKTHVKYGGSGLGLFISKSLTWLQGGAIGVQSKRDVGSTFAFFVSTRIAHPPASASVHAPQARPRLQRSDSNQEAMRKIKLHVLIVEDNVVNQRVLKKQLQGLGWHVSVAGNGQEALEWLKESVYWRAHESKDKDNVATGIGEPHERHIVEDRHELDIILMDIEMPVMDGLTCSRLIRDYEQQGLLDIPRPRLHTERPASASSVSPIASFHENGLSGKDSQCASRSLRIPILAVSANARMEQIELALASGMDDAISKPFRIPELWPKIRALMTRSAEG